MNMRRWPLAVCVVAVVASLDALPLQSAPGAGSEIPRAWNELALKTARLKALNDARSARLFAMVNTAMYDAVNGIVTRHGAHEGRGSALVEPAGAPAEGDISSAASAAAHAVLAGEHPEFATEFPDHSPGYDAQFQSDLVTTGSGRESAGAQWGADVGNRIRVLRTGDMTTVSQPALPGPTPGKYQAAWSGTNLAPFAVAYPVGPGPAPLDSIDYAAAFAEVKVLGNAGIPDAATLATSRFWALGGGTSQPPGAWTQIAFGVLEDHPLDLADTTRLLALLTMAMADTVGPTTNTKAAYRHWRPTVAIREAATDGNPYTDADPAWTQRGTAATSPENYSGHSAFGGSGASALAGFFCNDTIAITQFRSDSAAAAGLPARDYSSFSAAGAEMGRSRVMGGLHFEFSNQQGQAAGRAIAGQVLATKLLRRDGPTHYGQCPL